MEKEMEKEGRKGEWKRKREREEGREAGSHLTGEARLLLHVRALRKASPQELPPQPGETSWPWESAHEPLEMFCDLVPPPLGTAPLLLICRHQRFMKHGKSA